MNFKKPKTPDLFDLQDWLKVIQAINRDRSRKGEPISHPCRVQVWAEVIKAVCYYYNCPVDQERADLIARQIRDY